jgi:hypothetical protein
MNPVVYATPTKSATMPGHPLAKRSIHQISSLWYKMGLAVDGGATMSESIQSNVRLEAQRLMESLPEDASWDDVMYRVYVRQCVESGIRDADAGRVLPVAEVRRRFGLVP